MRIKILNTCDRRVIKNAEYCSIYTTSPVSSAVPCLHSVVSFPESWSYYLHILSAIRVEELEGSLLSSIQKLPKPPHKQKCVAVLQ